MNILLENTALPHCQKNLQKPVEFFKARYLLPASTLITLYNYFFMSFVLYGIVTWGQSFDSCIEPLFKLQIRAVRAICNQPSLAHSVPIFKDLKLLRIVDIFKLKLLSSVNESVNMVAPVCFHNFFFLNSTVHCHNTRQSTRGDLFLAKHVTIWLEMDALFRGKIME